MKKGNGPCGSTLNLSLTGIALHDDIWKLIQWPLEFFEEYIRYAVDMF